MMNSGSLRLTYATQPARDQWFAEELKRLVVRYRHDVGGEQPAYRRNS